MKWKVNPLGLLLGCLLAGVTFAVQAQSSSPVEWKRFNLAKGNFSVLFPTQPKAEFKSTPPGAAVSVDAYTYSAATEDASFMAQYGLLGNAALNWTERTKESFYEGVWTGVSESWNKDMVAKGLPHRATVVSRHEIKLGGYSGREVIFVVGPLQGHIWTTIIGRQMFGVGVLTENLSSPDPKKFMDSLIVTPKPSTAITRATTNLEN